MSKVTILDGGMGRQLEAMGAPFKQPEWSALALMEAPETVTQAHQAFLDAGCDIITTNAYALIPFHIGQERFDKDGADLIELAAQIARTAADEHHQRVIKVAGSLPPAFGSYRPDLFDKNKATDIYAPLIKHQESYIDFWLAETMSSIIEAHTIIEATDKSNKDLWLSFSLKDRLGADEPIQLRSGELLIDAIEMIKGSPVKALLFNCSQPEEMSDAFDIIQQSGLSIPYGAYANNFEKVKSANENLSTLRNDITSNDYLSFAKQWQRQGATIIGGCCGIGPDHIAQLTQLNN